jgi:RNA polymerase sigma factor (TIGR02999 family)
MNEVTHILDAIGQGDSSASAQLLPLVYDELRRLAAERMAREKPGQTLQPTALVHEAYLRLVGKGEERHWDSRGHFFAAAAEAMRRILIDNARRKLSGKHGGGLVNREADPDDFPVASPRDPLEVMAVHEALDRLAQKSPRRLSWSNSATFSVAPWPRRPRFWVSPRRRPKRIGPTPRPGCAGSGAGMRKSIRRTEKSHRGFALRSRIG